MSNKTLPMGTNWNTPKRQRNPDMSRDVRECQGVHAHSVEAVWGHDFCGECLSLMSMDLGDDE